MTANLSELVVRAAEQSPSAPALVEADSGTTTTWSELEDAVARCAAGLAAHGLVAGNRVALAVGNRTELVIAYLAALRARLVAVPVNPRSATGELLRIVADSGARLLVADSTTVDPARAVVTGLREALGSEPSGTPGSGAAAPRLVVLDSPAGPDEVSFDALLGSEPADLPPARDAEAVAVLLYTSGTSGRPRAAMLSHRALLANIDQAARVEPPMVAEDDVVYGVLPLFHVYGLNAVLGQVLARGATLVLVDGFDVEASLRHVEEHGVTLLPVAPPVLQAWRAVADLDARLSGVRTVLSGSAPLPAEVVEDYAARIGVPVHQGYGLTETAPVLTSTLCSRGPAKAGSVGAPLPGVELRLVDDDGRSPEAGDPGEIEVRGPNLFSGYWPDGAEGPGADGWWATGDVGLLDGDGDLFLVDRVKELILVSGFNVYPSEIEDVLVEVPEIEEAVVLGVPDERTGEAVVAYVRLGEQTASASPATVDRTLEAARRHAEQRLARFKWPSRIEVVDDVPRTVTGKVARGRLRARLRRTGAGRVPGVLE